MAKAFGFDDEVIIGLENPSNKKNSKSKKVSKIKPEKSDKKLHKIRNNKRQTNNLQKEKTKRNMKENNRKRNNLQKDNSKSNKKQGIAQNENIKSSRRQNNIKDEDKKSNILQNTMQGENNKTIKKQYNKKKRKTKIKRMPKILTLEQERKRKKIYRIIKIGIIILIILVAIVLTMFSPLFNIKEILVSGNNKLSKETIISISEIIEGQNTYKINKSQVEEKMKESNAYINKVKIKRILPSKIQIQVEERVATFMLEYGGGYVYLDEQGYILEISNEKLEIPIIQGTTTLDENIKVGNRLCTEDLKKLSIILKIMQSATQVDISKLITKIDISTEENYKIVFETEQKTAHLGDGTNITNKVKYIKLFLEDEKTVPGEIFVNMDLNKRDPYFRKQI